MGTYYGVNAVREKGVNLGSIMKEQPSFSGRLIGIASNREYEIAPDLTDKSEYDQMYDTYRRGHYLNVTLYSISEDELKNCPNKGRNYLY